MKIMKCPENTFFYLYVVANPGLPLKFRRYLSHFQRYKYFRFAWPYCYFRLSSVVEITIFELAMVDYSRFELGKNAYSVFLIKRLGALITPSATNVRKNRSAI